MNSMDLHIFFLPFLAPGHMIPMIDMARLFAERGVKATVVTTTANTSLIRPTIDRANNHLSTHQIQLLPLQFPSSEAGLPEGHENLIAFPTPDVSDDFIKAINLLEKPFEQIIKHHRPDCIVSDIYYTWSAQQAHDVGIPRLVFHGSGFFSTIVSGTIGHFKTYETVAGDDEPFIVPGLPHRIEMTRSQLPFYATAPSELIKKMDMSYRRSYGMVVNSFYEMEQDYVDRLKMGGRKEWHIGPVSLCNQDQLDKAVRGDMASVESDDCLNWLDKKHPGSVLYICFGSLGRFTEHQLHEIALGLEAANHPFIWVLRNGGDMSRWLPEGFEKRVIEEGKGMIISGWAPQLLILNHRAVGGFLTHCGWNSSIEGVSAGVPMITWPLFAEQFFNEKLILDVLKIGVGVGAKVCSEQEEDRDMVKGKEIEKAVVQLMGDGEEADVRRKRARELGETGKRAVKEGGSSYNDLSRLIEELIDVKTRGRIESD